MEKNKADIKAILNVDLEKLLKQTGQYNSFIDGELNCIYCGNSITVDNLSIIIPKINDDTTVLQFCCDKVSCLTKFRNDHE